MTAVHGQSMRVVFAFKINASETRLGLETTGVRSWRSPLPGLSDASYDGTSMRRHFTFTEAGKSATDLRSYTESRFDRSSVEAPISLQFRHARSSDLPDCNEI